DKINNFREWLDRQIDIVRPRVIVPMGQDAWEFFYRATLYKKPKIKFTKFVNKNMELPPYKKCKVIPIFRPSATNNKYNPKNIEILKKIVKYC
ncbi:MAG: uracil-DNA glycosylase family protein, partial [Candidatus Nanoarchaeia archaeon]|nr:hypothetical protein [Candidatus Jingweiarchaeum tengchongense]